MRWGAGGQRGRRIRCEVRTAGCSELGPPPPAGALGGGGCSLPAVPAPPASLSSGVHPPPATPLPARSLWPLASPFPARCRAGALPALRCVIGVGPRNSVVRVLERSSPPVCSSSVWVILSFLPFPFTYAKNPFHTRSICVRTT